jgi:hypothetical protein
LFINGRLAYSSEKCPSGVIKSGDTPLQMGVEAEISLNAWLLNKFGEPLTGLRYLLTLD